MNLDSANGNTTSTIRSRKQQASTAIDVTRTCKLRTVQSAKKLSCVSCVCVCVLSCFSALVLQHFVVNYELHTKQVLVFGCFCSSYECIMSLGLCQLRILYCDNNFEFNFTSVVP